MKRTLATLALGLGLAGGCWDKIDNSHSGVRGLTPDQAGKMNAEGNRFETSSDPEMTADTRFAAGQLAESQSAFAQAVEQYRRAIKTDPRHLPSLYRLGVLYTRFGKYDEAEAAWRKYIDASKGDVRAMSNLALTQELAGKPGEAEKTYLEAIRKSPKNEQARVNYGLMLARQGRRDEAVRQLAEVLPPAQVHYNLGSVYEEQGKRHEARTEYARSLELDPGLRDARARLAGLE